MKHRVPILAGTVLLALLMSACGSNPVASSSDTSASQPNSNKSSSAVGSNQSSAAQQVFEPGAGPILAQFTLNASDSLVFDSLEQVDPSTGTIKTVFKANITAGVDAKPTFDLSSNILGIHMNGWYESQVFDPSLQRLAVNWTVNSDGSHHVGWVNKNGTLTDVTAQLAKGASDFSAKPQDDNALFDAQGNFLYVDTVTGLLNRLNPDTMASVGEPVSVGNSVMLQGDGSVDTYQSDRLNDTHFVFDLKMPSGITITSDPDSPIEDLVDQSNVLVLSGGTLKVMGPNNLKKDSNGGYNTGDGTNIPAITPKTDFQYENATVSGDGKQAAFVASRGEERDLFVVPIDGSTGPKKLAQMNTYALLLFWL